MKRFNLIVLSVAAVSLSACGGQAYRQPVAGGGSTQPIINYYPSNGGGTTGTGTGTGNGSYTPALDYGDFDIYGTAGTVAAGQSTGSSEVTFPTVNTDNLLKVRLRARPGSTSLNNASYQYTCVRFRVALGSGQTMTTGLIKVPGTTGYCPGGAEYVDLDFSGYMTAGHGGITLTVKQVETDTYCQWQMMGLITAYGGINYCPTAPAHKQHKTTGNIQVQINGTQFVN